jgi:citrate lyase subunit beta/citryl-CoA lyase
MYQVLLRGLGTDVTALGFGSVDPGQETRTVRADAVAKPAKHLAEKLHCGPGADRFTGYAVVLSQVGLEPTRSVDPTRMLALRPCRPSALTRLGYNRAMMPPSPRALPVWRSLLYVPANVERFVDRAHTRGADVIQLDLEDSVPPAEKDRARALVESAAARVRRGGADVVVRINRPLSLAVRDVEACVLADVDGLAITKAQSASHVRLLDELIGDLEASRGLPAGHVKLITMIETPEAFLSIGDIVGASPRIVAANIGGEDFATACDMEPTEETLLYPKQHMIVAAKAAGVMPLGFVASVADYSDMAAFRAMVRRSRRFGFMGAGCIHPTQVAVVNEEYRPTTGEIAWARAVVAGYESARREGRASFALEGKMIDIPVVERAERLLAREAAIAERERRNAGQIGRLPGGSS